MEQPDSLEEIHRLYEQNGYLVLCTGVTQEWILDLVAGQFGEIQGGIFWKKYFRVEYDPEKDPLNVPKDQLSPLAKHALADFSPHMDGTFEKVPPKCTLLQCILCDKEDYGVSIVVDTWEIISRMSKISFDCLLETDFPFRFQVQKHYLKGEDTEKVTFAPLIETFGDSYKVRYRNDEDFKLVPPNKQAASALEEFETLITSPEFRREFFLKPGDILITNNWRVLHGRTPLSGEKVRKLRRLWVS